MPSPRPRRRPSPSRPFRGRRRFRLAALPALIGAAVVLLAGCGGDGPGGTFQRRDADPFPRGLVAAGSDVVCAPDGAWQVVDTGVDAGVDAGWTFRGVGDLGCAVLRPPAGPLVLVFTPAADSRGFRFDLEWDGVPLPGPGFLGAGGEPLVVNVPAGRLTPGSHVLSLVRRLQAGDGERHDNRVTRIARRLPGGGERALARGAAERYAYLADLLITGVTGLDHRRASGFLFAGPATWELELPAELAGGRLFLRPENLSDRPARFTVRVEGRRDAVSEARVAPRSRGEMSLGLGGGKGPLRMSFTVEGDPGGLYLWGAPRLGPEAPPAEAPPPILLVTLDTTRRDALGAYGGPPGLTPHLDRLAADATVYDRAATTAPWTLPSHASMFTGLYAGRHGAGVGQSRLEAGLPTLAGELRRHGYHTAGFAGGHLMDSDFGVARGFDVYADPAGFEVVGADLRRGAVAELSAMPPGPWFLFANFFDPHYAYRAPAEFRQRAGVEAARRALESPEWRRLADGDTGVWRRVTGGELPVTPAAARWLEAVYHAEVAYADAELGALLDVLRERGLYDRAWIVVVADHGELLGEGGHVSHGYRLDPELVEVPLIVKAPGQRAGAGGGGRSAALTSVADLFPTLLTAAGVPVPGGLDGQVLGGPDRGRVHYEEHRSRVHPIPDPHQLVAPHLYGAESRAARRVVWEGGQECFRRAAGRDGPEVRYGWRPVACDDDGAAALGELERRLGPPAAGAAERTGESLGDEEREALRALGYL